MSEIDPAPDAAATDAIEQPLYGIPPQLPPLDILFEDGNLIVVNKPAPLLTQAPPGIPSLEGLVKRYLKEKFAKPAGVYLGIPHRLDRPVSGVVTFARNTKAAQRVHAQFQEHKVRKFYWAIVEGVVEGKSGVWENWIRKLSIESRVVPAKEGEVGAKLAMLEYRVLQSLPGARTLIEFQPLTGRMHQLRVQAAWRGHPVLGDVSYGSVHPFGPDATLPRERVIALHARQLSLTHPTRHHAMTIEAPLPLYWSSTGISTADAISENLIKGSL